MSSFVREAALAAACAPASDRDEQPALADGVDDSQQVPESLEEVLARIWGVPRRLACWERDALGIPPSEDYWAWRKRAKGSRCDALRTWKRAAATEFLKQYLRYGALPVRDPSADTPGRRSASRRRTPVIMPKGGRNSK